MKLFSLFLFFLVIVMLPAKGFSHNEIVGAVTFTNYEEKLYMRAVLDKRHLVYALSKEATCPGETMLKVCGSNYFLNHFSLNVNGQDVTSDQIDFEVQKDYIVILYEVEVAEKINQIEIENSYMLKYNNHGIVRVAFEINDKASSYDMGIQRKKIKVIF